ncbi:hypothetical protein I7I48_02605 [Histoplasma ohiense]|nr:hypothetical protein I7I48_02605 [Histoplasma ohiense (nom. inval.)]
MELIFRNLNQSRASMPPCRRKCPAPDQAPVKPKPSGNRQQYTPAAAPATLQSALASRVLSLRRREKSSPAAKSPVASPQAP